jgi:dUTP pyrophosphatase
MELKVKRIKQVSLPRYAKYGDAGLDIYSAEELIINPKAKALISAGIKIEIPKGYFGLIKDRSGLAVKHGLHCLAGVIDSGYRGELKIAMINLSDKPYKIDYNTRIAQMILIPIISPRIVEVDELEESDRGERGFGSTGGD